MLIDILQIYYFVAFKVY